MEKIQHSVYITMLFPEIPIEEFAKALELGKITTKNRFAILSKGLLKIVTVHISKEALEDLKNLIKGSAWTIEVKEDNMTMTSILTKRLVKRLGVESVKLLRSKNRTIQGFEARYIDETGQLLEPKRLEIENALRARGISGKTRSCRLVCELEKGT
jgi:hypothetical protein